MSTKFFLHLESHYFIISTPTVHQGASKEKRYQAVVAHLISYPSIHLPGGGSRSGSPRRTASRRVTGTPGITTGSRGIVHGVGIAVHSVTTSIVRASIVGNTPSRSFGRSVSSVKSASITKIVGIKVRVCFELEVLTSLSFWDVLLQELRNLLVGLQEGTGKDTGKGLVTLSIERSRDASMANATSTT